MESIKLSFEAIMPIFILISLGYMIKLLKLADKKTVDAVNGWAFKVFFPVLLFYNIYKTESTDVLNIKLIIFTVAGVLLVFALGYIAVLFLSKENKKRGVMLQGFFRANYAILGVPLVSYICGNNTSGLASLMVVVVIPVFNILAVIALEIFREGNRKINVLKILMGIIKNPLIIGCIVGLIGFGFGVKLPYVIEKTVKDVASMATALSIIVLGAAFDFSDIKGYFKENAIMVIARLVIIPLIIMPIAVWIGFRGEALACLLIVFASPIAVSSFSMAQQMDGDENLAAQMIVITSAFCLITLFLWIFALSSLGLF